MREKAVRSSVALASSTIESSLFQCMPSSTGSSVWV
jgi:hypothetical protein